MSILDKLVEKKDLQAYVFFRIKHLTLEKERVPFLDVANNRKEVMIKKLEGRLKELNILKNNIHQIKDMSKYYSSKVKYLESKKIAHLKGDV